MDVKTQELLFENTRKRHPTWTPRFCSGYVHGANDEGFCKFPDPSRRGSKEEYNLGYLIGFVVCRGPEIETMTGFDPQIMEQLVYEALGRKTS